MAVGMSGRRIVVNGMFGQNSVRMAFKQNLAGTLFVHVAVNMRNIEHSDNDCLTWRMCRKLEQHQE